jgi:PTH1 family peptidyl-tRNA hydrolase
MRGFFLPIFLSHAPLMSITACMWLIAGLGNPGQKYLMTRHNVGFLLIDYMIRSYSGTPEKSEHKGLTSKIRIASDQAILCKPQTFMNLSGESVQPLAAYYKIPSDQIVVIHDEIDLPFGKMKLQHTRGHGGHNGIRDIHSKLGKTDYFRIKFGVGRPENPKIAVADYVLMNFNDMEQSELPDLFEKVMDGIETLIEKDFQKAATLINS